MIPKSECLNCLHADRFCKYKKKIEIIGTCEGYHPLITFKMSYDFINGKLVKIKK